MLVLNISEPSWSKFLYDYLYFKMSKFSIKTEGIQNKFMKILQKQLSRIALLMVVHFIFRNNVESLFKVRQIVWEILELGALFLKKTRKLEASTFRKINSSKNVFGDFFLRPRSTIFQSNFDLLLQMLVTQI